MTVTFKITPPNKPPNYEYVIQGSRAISCTGVAHTYKRCFGQEIHILRPRLDKISILLDFKDEDEQQGLVALALSAAKDADTPQVFEAKPGDFGKGWGHLRHYKINLGIRPEGSKAKALCQIRPRYEKYKHLGFVRLEFSPAGMGPKGFLALKTEMANVLGDGAWETLIKKGRVSAYHVAVDFIGVKTREMLAFKDAKKKSKTSAYYSHRGRLETHYLTLPGNVYVYDKRQERLDKGKEPEFGDMVAHSRLEIRRKIKQSKCSIFNLMKAPNPLGQIRVIDCYKAFPEKHEFHEWLWFLDSARHRGIEKAMGLATEDEVLEDLGTCLLECEKDVFPTKKIWATWKDSLKATGMFD